MVHDFISALTAAYAAAPPSGLPAAMAFVERINGLDKARPCIIIGADNIVWHHPRLVSFELVMHLETRTEDVVPAPGTGKAEEVVAWLTAVDSVFLTYLSALQAPLLAAGILLKYVYLGPTTEPAPDGADGYMGQQTYKIRLQQQT
jgi:hypothetical protein